MKLLPTVLLVFLLSGLVVSCNKYEDGPSLSLRSAKNRITNSWHRSEATENGTTIMKTNKIVDVDFNEDGTYYRIEKTQTGSTQVSTSYFGSWELNNDKTEVFIIYDDEETTLLFELLELRKDRLKIRFVENGKTYIETFVEN